MEIESMPNSRSLTYLSEENYDLVITPYQMYGRNILNLNQSKLDLVIVVTVKDVQNCAKYIRTVLQPFWNCFYAEYTTALCERNSYIKMKSKGQCVLTKSDVVIIKEDKLFPDYYRKKVKLKTFIRKGWAQQRYITQIIHI